MADAPTAKRKRPFYASPAGQWTLILGAAAIGWLLRAVFGDSVMDKVTPWIWGGVALFTVAHLSGQIDELKERVFQLESQRSDEDAWR